MDSEEDEVSGTRPGFETAGDSEQAPKPSTDSVKPSRGRRGRKSRMNTAVTSSDFGDSRSCTGGSVRVLRARRAVPATTTESKTAIGKKKTASLLRGRGRSAGFSSKNSPVTQ